MIQLLYSTILVLILTELSLGQQASPASVLIGGVSQQQVSRRIFDGEHEMIVALRHLHPILETYIQSEWPKAKVQSPIDDAYFLSQVDFTQSYRATGGGRRGHLKFIYGGDRASKRVKVNNGGKWELYPDGYLDMLFADLEDFDADTYDLTYLQSQSINSTELLAFSVQPKMPRLAGKFKGQIWVEASTFKIVRIKGIFTSPKVLLFKRIFGGTIPLYLNFDSFRQEVAPGRWLPSYTYFDDNRTWRQLDRNGETDFHYRGHIFMWGYNDPPLGKGDASQTVLRLTDEKVLAGRSETEESLDYVVRRITTANNLDAEIHCRVLLTTPIELFSADHLIFISRGLLNIAADDSVVPTLLAHEIAYILASTTSTSSSDVHEISSVPLSASEEDQLWETARNLLGRTNYSGSFDHTSAFLAQLSQHSKQIPNLTRSRFGRNLLNSAQSISVLDQKVPSSYKPPTLSLRGKYTIDIGNGTLRTSQSLGQSETAAESGPRF